jgi:glyceraldehyde-3-phosphate dehydrogenase (NADP+)
MAWTAKLFIDGKWTAGLERREVRSPGSGTVVTVTEEAGPDEIEAAISAAARVFPSLRRTPSHQRARWLGAISAGIAARAAELEARIVAEVGKPVQYARGEVDRARQTFALAAEEATRIGGEVVPLDLAAAGERRLGLARRFPRGPVAAITPFNFPLNLAAHKLAPALACGAPVVWKPAPEAPGTAALLGEIYQTAEVPAGALAVVPCPVAHAAPLSADPRLRVLSFTGSAAVGWALKARAVDRQVLLELGGDASAIVCADADLDRAARRLALGAYAYAGQICISVQHVLCEEAVYQAFTDRFRAAMRELPVGDPADAKTVVGPLIRSRDADRVASWIEEARSGGATVEGGARTQDTIAPALLTGVPATARLAHDEVFGPVATLEPFARYEDALAKVNAGRWGLQASIFTRDVSRLMQAHETLEVGGLIHNEWPLLRVDSMPYGGVKASGVGREGLKYAIEDYTEERLLVMDLS